MDKKQDLTANQFILIEPETKEKITVGFERITPRDAVHYLSLLPDNQRVLSNQSVANYAKLMRKGLWFSTTDPIQFDTSGKLVNGQHRMNAIIEADCPVTLLVVRNVNPKSFIAMDDGKIRKLSDQIRAVGAMPPRIRETSLNAIVRLFYIAHFSCKAGTNLETMRQRGKLDNTTLLRFFRQIPKFAEEINRFTSLFKVGNCERSIPLTALFFCFYIFDQIDKEATYKIVKTIEHKGLPLDGKGNKSPAYHIYHYFRDEKDKGIMLRHADYIKAFLWAFERTVRDTDCNQYHRRKEPIILGEGHMYADEIKNTLLSLYDDEL